MDHVTGSLATLAALALSATACIEAGEALTERSDTAGGADAPSSALDTAPVATSEAPEEVDVSITASHAPDAATGAPVVRTSTGSVVPPQTVAELEVDGVTALGDWRWTVTQPVGSYEVFVPSDRAAAPTFEMNVAGTYVFRLTHAGADGRTGRSEDVVVTVVPDAEIHVELTWDTPGDPDPWDSGPGAGADLDLHYVVPPASGDDWPYFDIPWDVYWYDPSPSVGDGASGGPRLTRDDTDGAGPENLSHGAPGDGAYRVGAHVWDDHRFGPSFARVRIYVRGTLIAEVESTELSHGDLWDVGTIAWPEGTFEVYNDGDAIVEGCAAPGCAAD